MGEAIFFIFLGMIVGVIVLCYLLEQGVRRMKAQFDDELIDGALRAYKEYMIKLRVEKVKDIFYCYNVENDEFVCQGKDFQEIKLAFEQRFPGYGSHIRYEDAHHFPETKLKTVKDVTTKE